LRFAAAAAATWTGASHLIVVLLLTGLPLYVMFKKFAPLPMHIVCVIKDVRFRQLVLSSWRRMELPQDAHSARLKYKSSNAAFAPTHEDAPLPAVNGSQVHQLAPVKSR
jgi:hypothetical protein